MPEWGRTDSILRKIVRETRGRSWLYWMTGFHGGVGWGVTDTCDHLSAWILWRPLRRLLAKEHFAVCSWARLVRLRFVLPMFYNCPDICRQRLLINVAVILSVTFRSNSLNPKWVIIYFRADFNLSWSLCLPDPINGRFIALRWYFPALVQNWSLLRRGKGTLFIGSQYCCLFEVWGTCLRVLRAPIMR